MTLVETGAGEILFAFRDQMYLITFLFTPIAYSGASGVRHHSVTFASRSPFHFDFFLVALSAISSLFAYFISVFVAH